uniref:Uncharacterized protein n=1 Tax=Octopus bimaculoides TaxID=37653 RepID=A0A0L8FTS5_OCTBM
MASQPQTMLQFLPIKSTHKILVGLGLEQKTLAQRCRTLVLNLKPQGWKASFLNHTTMLVHL